ncbi:MAG: MFS transporter [Ruminococcaceae bacterium]|nr:MFS transporter [Oscillospiraceae bacterium]
MKTNNLYNRFASFIFFLIGSFYTANQTLMVRAGNFLKLNNSEMGILISAGYIGSITTLVFFGMYADRYGKKIFKTVASVFSIVGVALIAFASNFYMIFAGHFLMSGGMLGLENMTISLLEDNNKEKAGKQIAIANLAFGIGAFISPAVISIAIGKDSYRPVYILMTLLSTFVFCVLLFFKSIKKFEVKSKEINRLVDIFSFLKNKIMLLSVISIIVYIACEATILYWIKGYFSLLSSPGLSEIAVSIYWVMILVSRFVVSLFKDTKSTLTTFAAIGSIGIGIMAVSGIPALSLVGVALAGFGFGPIYGGVLFLGGHQFPEKSAAAYSLLGLAGSLGGVFSQPLIGFALEFVSVRGVYYLVMALSVILIFAIGSMIKRERKSN